MNTPAAFSCSPAFHLLSRLGRFSRIVLGLVLLAAGLPGAAQAQPFGAWFHTTAAPSHGFVEIPSSSALNPTGALTVEAWVAITDPGGCVSITGKGWSETWWLGICGRTLRSYTRGYVSTDPNRTVRDAGDVPPGRWTHVAVVYDGAFRRHYVNGELIMSWAETGPLLPDNGRPMRIGSDALYQRSPLGSIDEVRLWNVARTQAQIRAAINVRIASAQPGLVGVWGLNGNGNAAVGGHNGTVMGSGTSFVTFPVAPNCGSSTVNALCLGGRFGITTKFRAGAPGTAESDGHVVVAGADSGIFWFFNSSNWEVMVKALNACTAATGNRFWLFSAATTNVFYRMEVFDIRAGVNKIYFNYPGPPAPAVTDTDAFATCP